MKVLGIDPGLANFGIGVLALGEDRDHVFDLRVVRTKPTPKKRRIRKADDLADRFQDIARELRSMITADVVAIGVEAAAFPPGRGAQKAVIHALGRARGLVDMIACEHQLPVFEMFPQELKKGTTGRQDSSKADIREALEKLYPEVVDFWPPQEGAIEHAGDALAAARIAADSDVVKAARRAARARAAG